jgi:hypothetical protein
VRQNRVLFLTPDALRELNIENADRPQISILLPVNRTHLQKFSSLVPARDGGLWLLAPNGLAKLSGPLRNLGSTPEWQEFLVPTPQPFQNLRDPVDDDSGGVTALADSPEGSGPVLVRFDGSKWLVLATLPKNVTHAWRGADGNCWATTLRSLLQMKPGKKEMMLNDEISVQHIFDCAVETNGIFWLATSDGLFRHAPLTWRSPYGAEEISAPVRTIAQDQNGRLWAASADALRVLQNRQWKSYPYPEGGGDPQAARALFTLPNGPIVLGLGERLLQFIPASNRFENINGNANVRLKPLGLLKDGRLVVQVLGNDADAPHYQLQLYDGKEFAAFPYEVPGLDLGNELSFLFAQQNGNLWLAGSKGMACLGWNHEKHWEICVPPGEPVPESAGCLVEMTEDRIWCGFQDKISEFDGKAWHSVQSGFDRINAVLKARDGSVWVAAANGLHRLSQRSWAANTPDEGLPSPDVEAIYQDAEGRLWAGTVRGLSLYHPEADPDPPRTYVHELPDSRTSLPENAIVTISFSADDRWKYTPKDRLLFSYRLDQKDWSPCQQEKDAVFSDLLPGKHYFQVRAMDRNWNLDPKPAVFEFVIALPWYKESRSAAGSARLRPGAGALFCRRRGQPALAVGAQLRGSGG